MHHVQPPERGNRMVEDVLEVNGKSMTITREHFKQPGSSTLLSNPNGVCS
jgi:hypothetical protein